MNFEIEDCQSSYGLFAFDYPFTKNVSTNDIHTF